MVDVVLVDEDGTDVVSEVLVVGVTDTVLVVVGVTVDVVSRCKSSVLAQIFIPAVLPRGRPPGRP